MVTRWLLVPAFVGCFALGWRASVLTTRSRSPVLLTRVYSGPDGRSHAEQLPEVVLTPDRARSGLEASPVIRVAALQFARTAPGWARTWHVAERHQYIITLSGRGEIDLGEGHKVELRPGTIVLEEDSTGRGHISRTIGSEDRIALNIQLPDH